MSKDIKIKQYEKQDQKRWDQFVLNESANGTFLQTMNFFNYHPEGRFKDASIEFLIGGGGYSAVVPAHIKEENGKKIFCSHQGSTFGGLVIGSGFCKIKYLDIIFLKLDQWLVENGFNEIILKQTGRIYQKADSDLLDYYLFMNGYESSSEVGYYIDYNDYSEDILSNYSSSRRRDYRYSLKNNLHFKELVAKEEIEEFYNILCDNYTKFNKKPVHTLKELIDFKFSRLPENTAFYGVYLRKQMIAGGMIFKFGRRVFHTQYLAVKQDKTDLFANEFLYTNLIRTAKELGFKYMSFGTATLDGGHILNRPLAQFKEGFGMKEYLNMTYRKKLV